MEEKITYISLEKITLKIGSGATPKGGDESYKESGISLIRSLNVYDFGFSYKNLAFIDENQATKLKNVTVEKNDILLNITGASVGRCCIVPNDILPARVNQHVAIIRIKESLANSRYVYYVINSDTYKNSLLNLSETGTTREALTKDDISNFKIPFPSLIKQQQIAAILTAYDDLIETNNQRINNKVE
jgi:restriction endonuclease S subunit